MSPSAFSNWRKGNVYRICDISQNGKLLSKTDIEQRFSVTIPWLQYYQVYYMFNTLNLEVNLNNEPTLFELQLGQKGDQIKGLVSLLYKSYNTKGWFVLSSFQNSWAKECQFDSTKEIWSKI